jgi:integrase/recombinase XerC/integrase/recombinase XerD
MKNEAIAVEGRRRFERGRASARAFSRVLVEYGELRADPARAVEDHEVARLLDRIPATTPLELRDRAMFELACSRGLRAEELAALDLLALAPDPGEPALRAVGRYLEQGRGALAADPREHALFLSKTGRRLSSSDIRRRLRVWARHAAAQGAARGIGSMSTTPVYTRVESARLRAAYERSHPRA